VAKALASPPQGPFSDFLLYTFFYASDQVHTADKMVEDIKADKNELRIFYLRLTVLEKNGSFVQKKFNLILGLR